MLRSPLSLVAVLAAVSACGLPRDPDGTLQRVRGHELRVGVVVDTPWVTDSAGAAGGVEGALAGELARRLGARPRWVHAPQAQLMAALQKRELDLVVGGLSAGSPYAKEVGVTRPYYTDTMAVGTAPGTRVPRRLKGAYVAVREGGPGAGLVRRRGAIPVNVADLEHAPRGLVAAPRWELDALGLAPIGIDLQREKHVIAVAPGENAFLLEVDRMLLARRGAVPAMLRRAAK